MTQKLFDEKLVAEGANEIKLTETQKQSAKRWIEHIKSGKLEDEKQNYTRFQDTILREILGYNLSEDLEHEKGNIEFVIHDSNGKDIIGIEAKGTKSGLNDKQSKGYKDWQRTPVDQLWNYMGHLNLKWGIVTNYQDFILIDKQEALNKFYRFDFLSIEHNEAKLREFIYVFSKSSLLETKKVEELKEESKNAEREFTKEFYKIFHETRLMILKEFKEAGINQELAIHSSQLFLNRLMFIFFAEDRGLLERNYFEKTIFNILENGEKTLNSSSYNVFDNILGIFEQLDNKIPLEIAGFNGELFKEKISRDASFRDFRTKDYFKDYLQSSKLKTKENLNENEKAIFVRYQDKLNPIIQNILIMASYDFQNQVNVEILGHIFEQSISDLEELKNEGVSKRKKDGVFYTPEYITDYICRNTIIPYLSKSGTHDIKVLVKEYGKDIEELENKFKNIKILDPACGSGAFLIKSVDIMMEVFNEIQQYKSSFGEYNAIRGLKQKSNIQGQMTLKSHHERDEVKEIIENSIFGVDINEESVEITKLALFLKLAKKGKKLINLSKNIKKGNSLVSDKSIDVKAFDWKNKENGFGNILDNGGFDIVIGNPPYVNIANISDSSIRKYYQSKYKTVKNKSDLYSIFTEKATTLLKKNGLLSFIFSNSWLGTDSFSKFREFLVKETSVLKLVKLPYDVFEDATVTAVIIVLSNSLPDPDHNIELLEFVENKFVKMKNNLNYGRIRGTESLTFSFEPNVVISKDTVKLGEIASFSLGIKTSNDNRFILDEKKDQDCYPVLRGKDISRYYSSNPKKFIWYKPKLMMEKVGAGPRHLEYFLTKEKILFQSICGGEIKASLDTNKFLTNDKVHIIYSLNDTFRFKYILSIVNSSFIKRWIKSTFNKLLEIKINQLKQIPIPQISLEQQKPFIDNADLMLKLNKELNQKKDEFLEVLKKEFKLEKISNNLDEFYNLEFIDFLKEIEKESGKIKIDKQLELKSPFEKYKKSLCEIKTKVNKIDGEIDQLVYKLYQLTPEEIKIVDG